MEANRPLVKLPHTAKDPTSQVATSLQKVSHTGDRDKRFLPSIQGTPGGSWPQLVVVNASLPKLFLVHVVVTVVADSDGFVTVAVFAVLWLAWPL